MNINMLILIYSRLLYSLTYMNRSHLSREQVLQYMSALTAISFLTLDYRRVYANEYEESRIVSEKALDSSVDLSMKFTEIELRVYLGKLSEWKDLTIADDKSPQGRSVVFYKLLSKLGGIYTYIYIYIYILMYMFIYVKRLS